MNRRNFMRGRGEWRSVRPITARLCQRHRRNGTNSHIQILDGFTTRSDPQPTGRMPRPYLEHRAVRRVSEPAATTPGRTNHHRLRVYRRLPTVKKLGSRLHDRIPCRSLCKVQFRFLQKQNDHYQCGNPLDRHLQAENRASGRVDDHRQGSDKNHPVSDPYRRNITHATSRFGPTSCVMTLESFLGFINPKSQNISNYIR